MTPDVEFTYNGTVLDDGRVRADHYITISCPNGKNFSSFCLAVSAESSDGRWTPAPSCPNVTGKCCHSVTGKCCHSVPGKCCHSEILFLCCVRISVANKDMGQKGATLSFL